MNQEYRMQRGRILKILYRSYDKSLSVDNMAIFLHSIGLGAPMGVLKAHMTYLKDRGLIRFEEMKSEIGRASMCVLTPAGVDFVEKEVSDDGVELGV